MLAMKMIEEIEAAGAERMVPVVWRMRGEAFARLKRQSRHTGDVRHKDGAPTFFGVPIEIADTRNALGAELLTRSR